MKPLEKDVGMKVIDEVVENLTGTGGNLIRMERSFVLDTDGITQTVWAAEPEEDDGEMVSRVFVETPFLKNFPSLPQRDTAFVRSYRQANIFGLYRKQGGETLFLRSSVRALDRNRSLLAPIIFNALTAQLTAVFSDTKSACRFLGCSPAFSGSVLLKSRGGRKQVLMVADPYIEPNARPWNCKGIYAFLHQKVRCDGFASRIWSTGMAAGFPVIPNKEGSTKKKDRMFFVVTGEQRHPLWGAGILFLLELPHRFKMEKIGENVFDLNMLEQETPARSHYLGFWCANEKNRPAYVSFIPWFLCSEDILLDQLFSAVERASWINNVEFY